MALDYNGVWHVRSRRRNGEPAEEGMRVTYSSISPSTNLDASHATATSDPVAAIIRNGAVDRLIKMNARHANNAWDMRRTRPLAPHAIAFLYADPTEDRSWYSVAAGTRLFLDG